MEVTFALEEIDTVAKQLLESGLKQIVVFHAPMGAGKTTLIKAIARSMGVKDITSSPTFSLVNEYETADGNPLYHFDLYRINSEEEAYDMGIDEYFYSGNMCLIEWPEKTPNLIPLDHSSITIKQLSDGKRHVTLK
ncbi:tRNA (adenosine(37)-N6)-threonylcarbamoyltransferase complex ATPase subunit type 1 TsaE [Flavobacterium litorale]|uniref:tRNA threonylcarbamoyladenosine biosynthesis protein TsaE n=1 Tax=Flavobacterium litorale TaxID=2856519 RepID=A0ABX8V6V0_9FLAO|nr:tRNA (adenosine(37)-N6)-threonylcarbamoyltransferase complex ATPase subunit type 1 TsaE [Flavobacterium litorale]QYJ67853.1 tRNA (adenosine(37)-N6)-threonylcarbamoyltransferase complex ATPase subunit type 1 TsaE [Flavobacterium litorale]